MGRPKSVEGGIVRLVGSTIGVTGIVGVITVLQIMAAYRAGCGIREVAPHGGHRGHGRNSVGSAIGGIAIATIARPKGRSVGVDRRVITAAGVATWIDVVIVLGVLGSVDAQYRRRGCAAHGRHAAGEPSTKGRSTCDIAVATTDHPNRDAIVWRVESCVGIVSRVDIIAILKASRKVLVVGCTRDSGVAWSVTDEVDAIVCAVKVITDTVAEVVILGIGSDIGEASSSKAVVWREADSDIADAQTETVVIVYYSGSSDGIERIEVVIIIVRRGIDTPTEHGLAAVLQIIAFFFS